MNRLISSRLVLARAASVSVRSRPITQVTQTTIKQTTISSDPNAVDADTITETYVTSETNKVGVVTQKEVMDGDGTMKRQTIPPAKWDADLASTSEEIVKAERDSGKKNLSMEAMQKKSLKNIAEKEKKYAAARKPDDE